MMRITALLLALAPATAWADACQDTVKAAYDALAKVPAVAQTLTMEGTPTIRMITVGDTLHLDQGEGTWTRVPLQPGMRQQMMQQTLPDASALGACATVGSEALEGAAMTVYQYLPPSIAGETPSPQKLWIGDADGLPHRMTTEQAGKPMEMTITYEGVTAPAD